MKRVFRSLGVVLLVILVLVVAVVAGINFFADRALKIGIETAGTKALNVGVSVGDVDLSIMRGRVRFRSLSISNPPGYKYDKLLELADGEVEVEARSLLGDVVHIREIKLDGADLFLEQRGISGNNLQDVVGSISSKDKRESEPSGKKLHVDKLEVTNVIVRAKLLGLPGEADTVTLKLKPIVMHDLGSDEKLDTGELAGRILLAVAAGIGRDGKGVLPDEIVGALGELKGLEKLPEVLLEEGGKILKKGKELGTEIGEGFKGLFESKKKEE